MNRVDDTNSKDSKILKAFAQKRWHFRQCCYVGAAMVLVVMITENVSPTGYGRFGENTTIGVDPRLGWWLMELPCSAFFPWFFLRTARSHEFVPRLFACIFMMHYLYRGWIFPCLIRVHGKSTNFSLVPAIGGWMVTILHAYFNAKWFGEMGSKLNKRWLRSWKFILGALLYYSGLIATIYHDHIMRTLRDGDGPRYRIPHGGLFEHATCAHYFVELWMWFGFMIMSWGPNGLFIFLISCMNLIPRSVTTHQWYHNHFNGMDDAELYPANRTQLVPLLW